MTVAHPASKNSVLLMKPLSMTSWTSQRLVIKSTDCYCLLSSQYRKKPLCHQNARPWIMLSTEKSFCVKIASKTFLECSCLSVTLTLTLHDLKKIDRKLRLLFFFLPRPLWWKSGGLFRVRTFGLKRPFVVKNLPAWTFNACCKLLKTLFSFEWILKDWSS